MSPADPATNVVLGAASGMGAAVAARLAGRGPLLLADRDVAVVAETGARLGPAVTTMGCDVTNPNDVEALVDATGRLGALVLTAGLSPSMAAGRRIFEVNLLGTQQVLRGFERALAPGSSAVCFASMAAHLMPCTPEVGNVLAAPDSLTFFRDLEGLGVDVDDPGTAYALSKIGVIRLVQHRAGAWGERGARLVSLSPGIIDTGMGRLEAANEPAMAQMVQSSALRREGRPEEVAAVAAFLVSEGASFITGVDILVDGGVVATLTSSQSR